MQIAEYAAGRQRILKHVGSAHTEAELGVLLARAGELLDDRDQGVLELGVEPSPPSAALVAPAPEPALLNPSPASGLAVRTGPGRVVGTDSRVLFEALAAVYAQLGFGVLEDEVFAALVLARVVSLTTGPRMPSPNTPSSQVTASYRPQTHTPGEKTSLSYGLTWG